jgi:hypothetical protein
MAISALGVRSRKLSNLSKEHRMGDQNYLEVLCASEGTLSRWSRLHLQLTPTPFPRRIDGRQAGRKK